MRSCSNNAMCQAFPQHVKVVANTNPDLHLANGSKQHLVKPAANDMHPALFSSATRNNSHNDSMQGRAGVRLRIQSQGLRLGFMAHFCCRYVAKSACCCWTVELRSLMRAESWPSVFVNEVCACCSMSRRSWSVVSALR